MGHLGVVGVDGVETGFIFEGENEYDSVNPGSELQHKNMEKSLV